MPRFRIEKSYRVWTEETIDAPDAEAANDKSITYDVLNALRFVTETDLTDGNTYAE